MYESWAHLFGKPRADQIARTLPPRPLRGRWGSIHSWDLFLLRCSYNELPAVFRDAVITPGEAKAAKAKHKDKPDLGDLDVDEDWLPQNMLSLRKNESEQSDFAKHTIALCADAELVVFLARSILSHISKGKAHCEGAS